MKLPVWVRKYLPKKKKRSTSGTSRIPQRYVTYRKRSALRRKIKKLAFWSVTILVVGYCGLSWTLPDIEQLGRVVKARSILIKSQTGQIIGSFGDIYGEFIHYEDLPISLVDAVMATEDRNFYSHFGIDPAGIARATLANIRARHVVQGGSTITQQVAKNVFLTPERSFSRKLREVILAFKLERRFTKQEIMSIYLNRVYLGAGNYGVDAASRRYFGKSARDLSLSESAVLAGLLKAPSRFSPTANPELSRKRAEQVLRNMEGAGYLTKGQADKAIAELAKSWDKHPQNAQSSLYFADWILEQLPEYVGNTEDDLTVITTLDTDMQLAGEKAIATVMDKEGEKYKASQAALLAMTPAGAIRAMVGGRDYGKSQYNRATQAQRQPGSSFKLFVYLAGLEAGLSPDTQIEDQPISIPIVGGKWEPKNYTGRYLGLIPLREAVAESINTVSVQVSQIAGLDHVIEVAQRLGITSPLDPLPSIALGSTEVNLLELTTAYAHLAADGAVVHPYGILEIDTKNGEVVYQRQGAGSNIVLAGNIVGMMNDLLEGVVTSGTGRGAAIGRSAAGKTGTTSDYRDAWFIGYTPDLVAGVWVGNDDNQPMKKVTGGTLPAPIWRNFMQTVLANTPARELPTSGIPSPMPWQARENFGPSLPPEQMGQAPPEPDKRGLELGPSFWDKLLGTKPPKVKNERKYPHPAPQR